MENKKINKNNSKRNEIINIPSRIEQLQEAGIKNIDTNLVIRAN